MLGIPDRRLVEVLVAQQEARGSFYTHYQADAVRLADPNVETTSVAMLALYTVEHGAPRRFSMVGN